MSGDQELLTCSCGSQWFGLHEGVVEHGRAAAAVCVTTAGEVIAYSGLLCCIECGTAQAPPSGETGEPDVSEPLRLVK